MPTSQNGYRANDRSLIDTYRVPGTEVLLPVRKGDVATVLLYVAGRFHNEVEKLHEGWCWGYAERTIRGNSTTLSNHASGTAIDLNAPAHPLGTDPRANFSRKQIRRIRRIVKDCDGCIRWGGDYSGRKDGMHFEINRSPSAVSNLAKRITSKEPAEGPKQEGIASMAHRYYYIKKQDVNANERTTLTLDKGKRDGYALGADMKFVATVSVELKGFQGRGQLRFYQYDADKHEVYYWYDPVEFQATPGATHVHATQAGTVTHGRHLRVAIGGGSEALQVEGGRVDMLFS